MNHLPARCSIKTLLTLVSVVASLGSVIQAAPFGTAFTYQGRLSEGGRAAIGIYDLRCTIYGVAAGGSALAGPLISPGVLVSNGLFAVQLDFGAGVFNGDARWLEIAVHTNDNISPFVTLTPRQPLTATPYALHALSVTLSNGAVMSAHLADGSVTSSAISDSSILPADLKVASFSRTLWKMDGNAGTSAGTHFLGTTDIQPIEVKVNGQRALRLEPTADGPNVVGGWQENTIAAGVVGATISGGGGSTVPNTVVADSGTISGGTSNLVAGRSSTVGGGFFNRIESDSEGGTIAGGAGNLIESSTRWATIAGGVGQILEPNADAAIIAGGFLNKIKRDSGGATISGGAFNLIRESSEGATIGGGAGNHVGSPALAATIGGGRGNMIEGLSATSTIGGGEENEIGPKAAAATIGGGAHNTIGIQSFGAMIPGGESNSVSGSWAFAAGRRAQANHNGTFVWADDTDADFVSTTNKQFAVRANNGVLIQAANTALELRGGGAVRVRGSGLGSNTPVFIHRATAANISANITVINHPHCNNDPNAILIVTPNWNPGGAGGTYNSHPVGVYYNGTRWTIFNQDIAAMPVNAAFNVLVFKP